MRILLIFVFIYLLAICCSGQVFMGAVSSSRVTYSQSFDYTFSQDFTVVTSDRLQRVEVTKHGSMQVDYDDLRFIVDASGSTGEKLYLPYWIESSDVDGAVIWVAFKQAPEVSSTFTMIWGDASATAYTSGYRAFDHAGYYFNDFSRGIDYDVVNVLGGYDLLVAGDANGEETWPAGWQDPDDPNHIGVIYKRQDTNLHAGNPTTRTGMRISEDGGQTWGSEIVIDNPGSAYNTTSSSSVTMPVTDPQTKVFEVDPGLPWIAGDSGQARADDTHYFDFGVISYTGTTLTVSSSNHSSSGTFSSWIISDMVGSTNATIAAVKMPNQTVRLIMLNSHVNYSLGDGTIRVGTKYSDDWGDTWSTWTQRGPDAWINVGGQGITMNNGYCVFSAHQNFGFEGNTEQTDCFFITRDYGSTFEVHTVQLDDVYLDEAGMFQKKNKVTWAWSDTVRVIMRNEASPFHYYKMDMIVGPSSTTNTTPVENNFYVDEQSRGTYTWADNRVWGAFGDVREQMVYSDDSGDTWNPVPYTTIEGNIYSSRRVYTIMWYLGNGKLVKGWTNNKLSGGADTYVNYWDSYLMALRAVSTSTLTDSRNRPTDLAPGLRINGSLVSGYRTSSSSSVAIPTSHPTQVTFTVSTGLSWQAGDAGTATRNITGGASRFTFTVDSYSGSTLVVNSVANTNTGTFSSWVIDKTSNFLADQAFVSNWNRNGTLFPFRLQMTNKSPSPHGGFYGLKKDETRATAVVTITDAGDPGDTITIKWSSTSSYAGLFTGIGKVAEYVVQTGDDIADVVQGLVISANKIGICPVTASDGTTLTISATRGESTNVNGRALTVQVTGTVAGNSGNFASGATPESVTSLSNVIVFTTTGSNIEQANDNFTRTITNPLDTYNDYLITWNGSSAVTTINANSGTKTSGDGSGVPNWPGQVVIHNTTSATAPWVSFESTKILSKPITDTDTTPGSVTSGGWTERSDGQGLN